MLDSPTGTGRWALGAGEETRRWWPTGLYSLAGPEAKTTAPVRLSLPLTLSQLCFLWPLTSYLFVAQNLACGWVSLGLKVGGHWGPLCGQERPGIHFPLPFSAEKENNFQVFFLSYPSFLQGPISLVQTPHRAECSTPCRGNQAGDDKNKCSASCRRPGAQGGRPWGSWKRTR